MYRMEGAMEARRILSDDFLAGLTTLRRSYLLSNTEAELEELKPGGT